MRQPYKIPTQVTDEKTLALANRIIDVILGSYVSFRQADDALTAAQDILLDTRPVRDD